MDERYDEELDAAIRQNAAEYFKHDHDTGHYLSPMWNFARIVRPLPPFREASVEVAVLLVDEHFVRKGYSDPELGWEEEFAAVVGEAGDACQMFIDAWEHIRFGYGETLLSTILQRT